jgi:hypothetical protein
LTGCNVGITDFYYDEFMMYAVEMASCGIVYLPSFMKIGSGVQGIVRFCLRNLRGWWHDICTKFHEDGFRHLSNIRVVTATI